MASTGWSQVTDTMSVEQLFSEARTLAYDGKTERARVLLGEALKRAPEYTDVRLFLGRTYAWDGSYSKAREIYLQIINKHPEHQQTWLALAQVELWSKRYQEVLKLTGKASRKFPEDPDLVYLKAQALMALERFDEAQQVRAQLASLDPTHDKLDALRDQILHETQRNVISWITNGDFFSEYYDAGYETRLQYERKADWGAIIGRINMASRFDQQGVQPELDMYPKLGDRMYAYLNYGYSGSDLYPQHRMGGELFRSNANGMEYSVGARYLYFEHGDNVTVLTASGSAYFGNWWISARPFFAPFGNSPSGSFAIKGRRYMGDHGDYLGAEMVIGASYDERIIQLSDNTLGEEAYLLENRKMAVEWLHHFSNSFASKARAEFGQQELSFSPDEFIWVSSVQVSLEYRF
ncbi:MAG: YaiO family outer membrane beta-barrel protein [Bacteroidota bacterium]